MTAAALGFTSLAIVITIAAANHAMCGLRMWTLPTAAISLYHAVAGHSKGTKPVAGSGNSWSVRLNCPPDSLDCEPQPPRDVGAIRVVHYES